jgi:hypothetical protein
MELALMIVFFWLGCALLAVAFHPLTGSTNSINDVFSTLQTRIAGQTSAYNA